ncbi:MAG TPA: hypothetical protein VKF81_06940 [Blastocatellia bacterium]|nr:hypothetical protein [Blastocatellia bacterium]
MIEIEKAPPEVDQFQRRALIVGGGAMAVCVVGAVFDLDQFFRSYLLAFIFWVGIALGCFALLMVQHMSGGAWGLVIRRLLESATRTFPLLALMFLPVAFGVRSVYKWARPPGGANEALTHALAHKAPYLNIPFFLGRAVFYFAVWNLVSYFLNKWSLEQDRTGRRPLTTKLQSLSGPGLVLYGLTVTFASIDWVMSLEPQWFSTMFGILVMGGQGLSAMAFVIAVIVLLSQYKPLSEVVRRSHLHDLGKLMLAFLMLWTYFGFSQFLIIWSGNLPDEIPWYVRRLQTPWRWVGLALIVFQFALPFVLLLSRDIKRNARTLVMVASTIIVMRLVDVIWLTEPELHEGAFRIHWMDIVMPIALGGLWLAFFAYQLKTRPLLPIGDPFLETALAYAERHEPAASPKFEP